MSARPAPCPLGLASPPSTTNHRRRRSNQLYDAARQLNADPRVRRAGAKMPLPAGLDATAILARRSIRAKDVDGLLAENVGQLWLGRPPRFVPVYAAWCHLRLLRESGPDRRRAGGRGRPLLTSWGDRWRGFAVGACHGYDLPLAHPGAAGTRSARRTSSSQRWAGRRRSWATGSTRGAVVIDVGISRLADGRVVGDVDFDSASSTPQRLRPFPAASDP